MMKSEKGISLLILAVTIMILVIVTGILAVNSKDSLQMSNLTKLNSDIQVLNDRVAVFYVQNEKLPIYQNKLYTKEQLKHSIKDLAVNDGDEYYTLDLSQIDNLSLNYDGEYIINQKTHCIYYKNGIMYNGILYHTSGEETQKRKSNEVIQEEEPKPDTRRLEKPKIEVTSGTSGENEWYKTEVQVTISDSVVEEKSSKAVKMQYIISGATELKDTEEGRNKVITISADGITYISAYAIDEYGNQSEKAVATIKKDSNLPKIELSQAGGTEKEYSKQITVNISDDASKIAIKKYAVGVRDIAYFENGGSVVSDSFMAKTSDTQTAPGTVDSPSTTYTVYAKDEAGNAQIGRITVENLLIDNEIKMGTGICLTEGTEYNAETGRITLKLGNTQFGPYWNVPPGKYEIIYNGENLPETGYDSYTSWNGTAYTLTVEEATGTMTRLNVEVTEHENIQLEVRVSGVADKDVYIDSIRIKQLQ